MKTKRRHELQTNVLADWMGKQIEVLRPHSQAIALGAVALVAVIAGVIALGQIFSSPESGGWPEYFGAFAERDPEKLAEVASAEGVDDRAANWALLTAAELQMSEGAQLLYENHDDGAKKLEEAKDKLDELAKRAPSDPYLKQRSQFVLGQIYESLAAARTKGAASNLDKARKHYEQAKEVAPDTPLGKSAGDALARLKDEKEVTELLTAFAKHEPPQRTGAGDLTQPPSRSGVSADNPPLGEGDLPSRPDLSFPGLGLGTETTTPPVESGLPGESSNPPPVTEDAPGSEAPPSGTEPGESAPGETPPTGDPAAEPSTSEPAAEAPGDAEADSAPTEGAATDEPAAGESPSPAPQ